MKKIRRLTEADIKDAIELYADTCRYDTDYQKMFGVKDCKDKIIEDFSPDVIAAVRLGLCIGIYEKGKIIGCVLAIDWYKYLEEEPALFHHMFNSELTSTKELVDYMYQFPDAYFIFAMGVKNGKRCQGNASAMLKHFMKLAGKKPIVSDCIYSQAVSLWLTMSFQTVDIGSTQLVVKGSVT